jgi:hypothetical protein
MIEVFSENVKMNQSRENVCATPPSRIFSRPVIRFRSEALKLLHELLNQTWDWCEHRAQNTAAAATFSFFSVVKRGFWKRKFLE